MKVDALLRQVLAQFDDARAAHRPLTLVVPHACVCGRALDLELTSLFEIGLLRQSVESQPCLAFHRVHPLPSQPEMPSRLELRLTFGAEPGFSPEASEAQDILWVECRVSAPELALQELFSVPDQLQASVAWSTQRMPCQHAVPIPLMRVGKRQVPRFCPRARVDGDISLASVPRWPGIEACRDCPWFRGDTELEVRCGCPEVERGPAGLSLELDVYREDGRKRRNFLALPAGEAEELLFAIRAAIRYPGASPAQRVDIKFVAGNSDWLTRQSDAYSERWRFYWNGEHWVRKPKGASLHDWNKWGRRLEHLSVASFGSLPPQGGWPAVLDLPPGRYKLRVLNVEWRQGRKGEPELEWAFRVLTGTFKGRRVFRRSPVRTSAGLALVKKDLALVLQQDVETLPSPDQPEFGQLLERVKGVGVHARVALRDDFLNLYLNRHLTSRASGSKGRSDASSLTSPLQSPATPDTVMPSISEGDPLRAQAGSTPTTEYSPDGGTTKSGK